MLSGYREVARAAQSYRAIGLSGGVCYRGIGKNFQSGLSGKTSYQAIGKNFQSGCCKPYRGKLPIGNQLTPSSFFNDWASGKTGQ